MAHPPTGQSCEPASPSAGNSNGSKTHKGGNGRHGRDDYPGAKRERVEHGSLKAGDPCPACHVGFLSAAEDDGVAYRWDGTLPLVLTIYDLARLICNWCKTTFTATPPGETPDTTEIDPSLPTCAGKVKERDASPEAAAMLATLRFELGVPHFRTADAQAAQGVPLPPATQIRMMETLRAPGEAVFGALEKIAGNGELMIPDDTHIRVLDMERGKVASPVKPEVTSEKPPLLRPPRAKDKAGSKGGRGTTSAIIVKVEEKTICLHYTGFAVAGENLGKILAHRQGGQGPPLQMCDALSANVPSDFVTLLGNCLDHARRQFYGYEIYYPTEVDELMNRLARVYDNDREAKRQGLDENERFACHQIHSAPQMSMLKEWADNIKSGTRVMPNAQLMKPVNYLLRHWEELTLFLREPGVPLSSAEVERLIKRCIRHRKNSMQYKTLRGARFGDLAMTLIQTSRYAHESAHAYLAALIRYRDDVIARPEKWLPWNFRAAIAAHT
jgi:transposase